MTAPDGLIRIPLNEESGHSGGQIEEYLLRFNGEGIQHIALRCDNLIDVVDRLQRAGVPLMSGPNDVYYEMFDERFPGHGLPVGGETRYAAASSARRGQANTARSHAFDDSEIALSRIVAEGLERLLVSGALVSGQRLSERLKLDHHRALLQAVFANLSGQAAHQEAASRRLDGGCG